MEMYYRIVFFILGSIMGSFFHVVATRLSKDESIIKPSSHCHICNRKLKWYELIPILSYVIQGGKSRCCKQKLPISYLIIEVITGSLFSVTYHVFKLTPELLINLIFISGLIIVIISDIEYMIILDEVTSSLSYENEELIKNAINEIIKGRICIIIAHRLSTIKSCDKILLMKNGKIIEEGNHTELIERKGEYYELIHS